MGKNRAYVPGHYERLYLEVAEGVFDSGTDDDGFIHVDVPGLESLFAFPAGGLTVITGRSGAGKSLLCDNLFGWAVVPTVYFPLQSVSLVAAHTRMRASLRRSLAPGRPSHERRSSSVSTMPASTA